ncbi:hypothetical protein GIB67_024739, partial [Kingdonia uniflora]
MAGKHRERSSSSSPFLPSSTSALLIFITLSLLTLLFIFISISTKPSSYSSSQNPNPPEFSFVASLEKFLASPSQTHLSNHNDVRDLDDFIWKREMEVIRVYVYEMPNKFTYDLLWLFRNTYKETFNLTSNGSPVHRLIEQAPLGILETFTMVKILGGLAIADYCGLNQSNMCIKCRLPTQFMYVMQHSVDYWLWADLIAPESERLLKNIVRVHRQEEADLFYIPFFTTISFFLLEKQQCKALYREALKWVTDQPAWKRSEGRDHILPVHHPWSFKTVRRYMKKAIWLLPDMDSTGNWLGSFYFRYGTSPVKFGWKRTLFYLMSQMLKYVMQNACREVNQAGPYCSSSVGDSKGM